MAASRAARRCGVAAGRLPLAGGIGGVARARCAGQNCKEIANECADARVMALIGDVAFFNLSDQRAAALLCSVDAAVKGLPLDDKICTVLALRLLSLRICKYVGSG